MSKSSDRRRTAARPTEGATTSSTARARKTRAAHGSGKVATERTPRRRPSSSQQAFLTSAGEAARRAGRAAHPAADTLRRYAEAAGPERIKQALNMLLVSGRGRDLADNLHGLHCALQPLCMSPAIAMSVMIRCGVTDDPASVATAAAQIRSILANPVKQIKGEA